MNSEVNIIEPETLAYLPAQTLLRLVERTQNANKNSKAFQQLLRVFPEMFRQFEELDLSVSFNLDNEYVNLSFTGDGDKLKTVWVLLRRAGFNTCSRPVKGDVAFNSFWNREGYAEIFMMFSSTLCKRVQIGTKMVEQPIYETQCGDLPEIEAPSTELTVARDSDEIPF